MSNNTSSQEAVYYPTSMYGSAPTLIGPGIGGRTPGVYGYDTLTGRKYFIGNDAQPAYDFLAIDPQAAALIAQTETGYAGPYVLSVAPVLNVVDGTVRNWSVNGIVNTLRNSVGSADQVGVNGRAIVGAAGTHGYASAFLAHLDSTDITGRLYLTNGSATMTGNTTTIALQPPTRFLSELRVGDSIRLTAPDTNTGGRPTSVVVASIQSDSSLTLTSAWTFANIFFFQGFRTVDLKLTEPNGTLRTFVIANEMDVNNMSGQDVLSDDTGECYAQIIVSGGTNIPRFALGIYKQGTTAPFYNGLYFGDNSVYKSGIAFGNVNPESGIRFSDAYAGIFSVDFKESTPIRFRVANGLHPLMYSLSNSLNMTSGTAGLNIVNQARTQTNWSFSDTGDFIGGVAGKAISLKSPTTGNYPLQVGDDSRLRINFQIVPVKASVLTAPLPVVAAGANPTKAEFDALLTRVLDLEAKLRASGALS